MVEVFKNADIKISKASQTVSWRKGDIQGAKKAADLMYKKLEDMGVIFHVDTGKEIVVHIISTEWEMEGELCVT